MFQKAILSIVSVVFASSMAFAGYCVTEYTPGGSKKPQVIVNSEITVNTTWTSNNIYILDTVIYVAPGAELTIEPGTIIKGRPGANPGKSLIIRKGAFINAQGTQDCPIVFTAEIDDVDNPNDLVCSDRGLWGSVIILGDAPINSAGGINHIEGLPPSDSTEYGGADCDDSSGVFAYVQLKHGGSILGAANEINGLTMGGLGRRTHIHHIEVFANLDDGFEFFGGTVNTHHLVSVCNDDDDFDYDQGYTGCNQFLFSVKDETNGDKAFECDSWDVAGDEPFSRPTFYNVTSIGRGVATGAKYAVDMKEGAGGHIRNAIFTEWQTGGWRIQDVGPSFPPIPPGVVISDCATLPTLDAELRSRCWTGSHPFCPTYFVNPAYGCADMTAYANFFYDVAAPGVTATNLQIAGGQVWTEERLFDTNGDWPGTTCSGSYPGGPWPNLVADPQFGHISAHPLLPNSYNLDPRPASTSPVLTSNGAALPDPTTEAPCDADYVAAPYAGAFAPGSAMWINRWTNLWHQRYIATSWKCGDTNQNTLVNIADAVYLIQFMFGGGPAPMPRASGDVNCNTTINIADAVYLIQFIFNNGPVPCNAGC